ncbi:NAD-dependent epimerase/dehydratase family protein [Herbiconiux sp. CPCC 205763]|uniref:NAD-dependent epimerase/dehydratase family protein n=1 Tax=Herbiconiux aconitum TaxID=2970913 RepID=A0ABT2GNV8_9MICO|nr:NAD-dependent epimerase/dehydratase family protein [Herbiconiux aconitum]MCS5717801.1 NAD-dependent epimerase/dehydratase family protein [Herbiconiux aconitum]
MKIVVVGASGNLGTALLRRALRDQDAAHQTPSELELVGVSRRAPLAAEPYSSAHWHEIDISRAAAADRLRSVFTGADAVVHLGWALQPNRHEATMASTNVRGTRAVLDAVAAADVPQVLVASSVGAYSFGPKHTRVSEDWPTGGVQSSHYARHKAINERAMDAFERAHPGVVVTRIRPGLVFQPDAAREIARLFAGPLVPVPLLGLLRRLPALPLPTSLVSQAVHADDVADAFWRAIDRRAGGAFNIAAEPVLGPAEVAEALGVPRAVPLRRQVLRALVDVSWRLHLQATDPGWIDLATSVPVLSTDRARAVLGWEPTVSSTEALRQLVDAFAADRGHRPSASLRG